MPHDHRGWLLTALILSLRVIFSSTQQTRNGHPRNTAIYHKPREPLTTRPWPAYPLKEAKRTGGIFLDTGISFNLNPRWNIIKIFPDNRMHSEFGFEEDRAIFIRQLDKNCYLNPRNVSLYVIVFLKKLYRYVISNTIKESSYRIFRYGIYILWWQEISFRNNIREMNIFIQIE